MVAHPVVLQCWSIRLFDNRFVTDRPFVRIFQGNVLSRLVICNQAQNWYVNSNK